MLCSLTFVAFHVLDSRNIRRSRRFRVQSRHLEVCHSSGHARFEMQQPPFNSIRPFLRPPCEQQKSTHRVLEPASDHDSHGPATATGSWRRPAGGSWSARPAKCAVVHLTPAAQRRSQMSALCPCVDPHTFSGTRRCAARRSRVDIIAQPSQSRAD